MLKKINEFILPIIGLLLVLGGSYFVLIYDNTTISIIYFIILGIILGIPLLLFALLILLEILTYLGYLIDCIMIGPKKLVDEYYERLEKEENKE